MTGEQEKPIKVTVLLEHYEGEEGWTASVPLVPGCLAEGQTPEAASEAIREEIDLFTKNDPRLLDSLRQQPEFMITEVELKDG